MTLCDAGPLFALVDRRQAVHEACRTALTGISLPLTTTWPCFTEAMYLAHRAGGWPMQRLLWEYVRSGTLRFHLAEDREVDRMHALMRQYRDTPMDLADASLVAAAEALGQTRVFTVDSDFRVYRLHGTTAFDILP